MAKRVARLAAQVVASSPYVESMQQRDKTGGLLLVEHLNMNVVDNAVAAPFYEALGCSRNTQFPAKMNMLHSNVGLLCQFHLPDPHMEQRIKEDGSQIWRGKIEILYDDEAQLAAATKRVQDLAGKPEYQKVAVSGSGDGTVVIGPWGNRFSLRLASEQQKVAYGESYGILPNMRPMDPNAKKPKEPSARPVCLGLGDIYIEVPTGAAAKIARFYKEIFHFDVQENSPGNWSVVGGPNGNCQALRFQDVADAKPWGGEHLAMYIGDYEGTFQRADQKGLVWQNPRFIKVDNVRTLEEARKSQQFRLKDIIDLDSGEKIFELEHEVRGYQSKLSPLYTQ